MIRSILVTTALAMGLTSRLDAPESAVALETKAGTLHGTLLLSVAAPGPVPVVLRVASWMS